jgi:hypothetical protein
MAQNEASSDLFDTVNVADFDVHFNNGEIGQFTIFEGDSVEPANLASPNPTISVTLKNTRGNGTPEELTFYVRSINFTSVRRTTRRFLKSGVVLNQKGVGPSRQSDRTSGTTALQEQGSLNQTQKSPMSE